VSDTTVDDSSNAVGHKKRTKKHITVSWF